MKNIAVALIGVGTTFAAFASPAQAQDRYYHSNGSGTRVIMQRQTGYVAVPVTNIQSSMSGTANPGVQQGPSPFGLKPTIMSRAVGMPGDRVSQGQLAVGRAGGNAVGASSATTPGTLAPCRTSRYLGMPGDGIRSDLGNRVSGGPAPRAVAPAQPVYYQQQQQTVLQYGGSYK